jgi:hypothetical protein
MVSVEIVYGAGWDPQRRKFVGAFPFAEAQRRDAAGEPYSVGVVAGDRMVAVLDRHGGYVALWLLDAEGRRTFKTDYRELEPGRIMLCRVAGWQYGDGEQEDDPMVGRYTLTVVPPMALVRVEHSHPRGGGSSSARAIDVERLWQTMPVLGDPSGLLPTIPIELLHQELLGWWGQPPIPYDEHVQVLSNVAADAPVEPHALAALVDPAPVDPPWRAPSPYAPGDLDAWFTDGARVLVGPNRHGGQLRVVAAISGALRRRADQLGLPLPDDYIETPASTNQDVRSAASG